MAFLKGISVSCPICKSEHRREIEEAHRNELSLREIAAMFPRGDGRPMHSRSTLGRHFLHVEEREPGRNANSAPSDSQGRLRELYGRVSKLLDKVESKGDHRTAAQLI